MNNNDKKENPSIKALIACKRNSCADSQFVPLLYDIVHTTGIDVRCSVDDFWESDTAYDIIHFQWPEEVVGWNCDELINERDLPFYIAASDVIFVQRKNVLNSTDVPLAFLFRKVAIGPDFGNTGELLNITGNPTFDPDNKDDIVLALKNAQRLAIDDKGKSNYDYALKHLNTKKVGKQYAELYKELAIRA